MAGDARMASGFLNVRNEAFVNLPTKKAFGRRLSAINQATTYEKPKRLSQQQDLSIHFCQETQKDEKTFLEEEILANRMTYCTWLGMLEWLRGFGLSDMRHLLISQLNKQMALSIQPSNNL
jgi:hypothetical protein